MNGTQSQPETEKLSDIIGKILAALENTEALTGAQLLHILQRHRDHLANLKVFACDYEFAKSQSPSPLALSYAAAAAVRLYQRTTAPSAPVMAVRIPIASADVVSLDRFRRKSEGGAS